jgi:hypothetical protein
MDTSCRDNWPIWVPCKSQVRHHFVVSYDIASCSSVFCHSRRSCGLCKEYIMMPQPRYLWIPVSSNGEAGFKDILGSAFRSFLDLSRELFVKTNNETLVLRGLHRLATTFRLVCCSCGVAFLGTWDKTERFIMVPA